MYLRNLFQIVRSALSTSPIVLVHGGRQTGKSTLVQGIAEGGLSGGPALLYRSLDDPEVLSAVRKDPDGFLASQPAAIALDEVQRAPGLFRAIKWAVDRERRPGRFLLTGSSNVFFLPRLSDSLAGRMEILMLNPLSQGEIEGVREGFVDAVFGESLPELPPAAAGPPLGLRVLAGGYPEAVKAPDPDARARWFASLVNSVLQRDVRDLSRIEDLAVLPRILAVLAARTSSILSFTQLAQDAGLPQTTLKRYLALLEALFLVRTLPAWSANIGRRLARSPKAMVADTGLACHLLRLRSPAPGLEGSPDPASAPPDLSGGTAAGALLETFVANEILRQSAWSRVRPDVLHFRIQQGPEVDLVLEEGPVGRIVGIEVKTARTATAGDFNGLKALAAVAGKRFHRGILLHPRDDAFPFGPRLHALPVSALWRLGAEGQAP